MNQNLKTNDVSQVLAAIRKDISNANDLFYDARVKDADVTWFLQCAYRRMQILLEALGLTEAVTGLPSIQTLIEYKFMADAGAEKRIADEVLADTRGYVSEEWTKFIYVIYETKRIKPESHWKQLFRASGVDANTEVIVISGEPPRRRPQPTEAHST
jgi:hypothetical protein